MSEFVVGRPFFKFDKVRVLIERDSALRAFEVCIVNMDREGNEKQVLSFYCTDNGKIMIFDGPKDIIDA